MINRREIIDLASRLALNPHIVEKDFVLGWVLAGIYAHDHLKDSWIFKGGTCLKKCYFETYRFSEDLDFTLTDASHIEEDFLKRSFGEVSEWVYENAGIELPVSLQAFDIYTNPRGREACQGKLSYRGPVSPSSGGLPRIKLDLTADERVVLPAARVPIFHPYSDAPEEGIEALAYAFEEAFAEKIRALAERTRPRDLYDVINLFRHTEARPSPAVLLDVLRRKCEFKGIAVPALADLTAYRVDLEGAWDSMLGHQLPFLPPVAGFWDELPAFFTWLEKAVPPVMPAAYRGAAGETVIRGCVLSLPVSGAAQSALEVIRFAASNRLCVDLEYQRSTRRIEPYSLRRTRDGNVILHAFNVEKRDHRSYRVDRIQGARVTAETFVPRYEVELTSQGPVPIPSTARNSAAGMTVGRSSARTGRVRNRAASSGPAYIYECPLCGKQFQRKTPNAALRPHKDKSGYPCGGRTALWVDTRY